MKSLSIKSAVSQISDAEKSGTESVVFIINAKNKQTLINKLIKMQYWENIDYKLSSLNVNQIKVSLKIQEIEDEEFVEEEDEDDFIEKFPPVKDRWTSNIVYMNSWDKM